MSYLNYVLNAKREKNTFVFYKESFDVFELYATLVQERKMGSVFLLGMMQSLVPKRVLDF